MKNLQNKLISFEFNIQMNWIVVLFAHWYKGEEKILELGVILRFSEIVFLKRNSHKTIY